MRQYPRFDRDVRKALAAAPIRRRQSAGLYGADVVLGTVAAGAVLAEDVGASCGSVGTDGRDAGAEAGITVGGCVTCVEAGDVTPPGGMDGRGRAAGAAVVVAGAVAAIAGAVVGDLASGLRATSVAVGTR
jgi:hypothetical protein